ncbi:tyrosine protein kinase [Enterococcus florum]|uniref:Tyrosine-protein kinase CpsD n=1 Tax=Enterococcus florum TaxID=2480627 RepID=A0A4P5PHK6_9ENTE|nr:CpsD/CapB family tyrosine-protein kinase [Enterococcus florum]GCF95808.1 tyrosine protein kinase [Enterococcus florum]
MKKRKQSVHAPVSLIAHTERFSMAAERYRGIRSNIHFSAAGKEIQTLVVTSAGPDEGKSTTAVNLAIVFADSGSRVLLVDADLRKPSIALSFQMLNTRGLSTLLIGHDATVQSCCQASGLENLMVLTSGPLPPNPSELLGSKRMLDLLEEMKADYDYIIFDLPPVVTVTDAQILAAYSDGTILVVRERKTRRQELAKAKELLTLASANVLGVVYNGQKREKLTEDYYMQ